MNKYRVLRSCDGNPLTKPKGDFINKYRVLRSCHSEPLNK